MSRQSLTERCKPIDRLFFEIIDPKKHHEQWDWDIIVQLTEDASDKFQIWKRSAGLLQRDTEFLLETYLSNAPRLEKELHDLLESLEETLSDATSITADLRENRIVIKQGYSQTDQEHTLKATTTTELEDLLGIASDTVGSLLRFLLLVDKFATRDHDVHALKSQHGMSPDSSDTDYVRVRYPKLDNPENKWLLKRLAQAITARREFVSSSRRHKQLEIHRHNTTGLPGGLEISGIHTPSIPSTYASASEQKMQSERPVEPESSSTSHFNFDTLACESSDALSTTDIETTPADGQFNIDRLRLPSLDDVKHNSQNSTFFECPLCLTAISLETEAAWQSHAHDDLKSYVCISEEQCDARLFGNQSAWIDHELRCHRCQWICVICQQGPFMNPEDFSGHLAQSHTELELPDKASEALKHASQCAVEVMSAMSCPFCDDWGLTLWESGVARKRGKSSSGTIQKQNTDVPTIDFLRHIATHLEQLAISTISENILNLAEINKGSDSGEVTSLPTSSSESDMEGNEPFLEGGDLETKQNPADETPRPKSRPGPEIKEPPNRQGESSKFEPPSVPIKTKQSSYVWYCCQCGIQNSIPTNDQCYSCGHVRCTYCKVIKTNIRAGR